MDILQELVGEGEPRHAVEPGWHDAGVGARQSLAQCALRDRGFERHQEVGPEVAGEPGQAVSLGPVTQDREVHGRTAGRGQGDAPDGNVHAVQGSERTVVHELEPTGARCRFRLPGRAEIIGVGGIVDQQYPLSTTDAA